MTSRVSIAESSRARLGRAFRDDRREHSYAESFGQVLEGLCGSRRLPLAEIFAPTRPSKTETLRQSSRLSTSERCALTAGTGSTKKASPIARL